VPAAAVDVATTVLSVAVLGFMGFRLIGGLRVARSGRGRLVVLAVRSRIGWRHMWPVPIVLALVLVAATALMALPGLDWGWWSALGGVGTPVFGSTDTTAGTPLEWGVPLVFLGLLVPALPLFANAEERMFRQGAEEWTAWHRIMRTVQFGLVHALIGIPFGAAIALSLGGAYFMLVYLRSFRRTGSVQEATLESTTAHTVYNGVIIGIVIIARVLTALGV